MVNWFTILSTFSDGRIFLGKDILKTVTWESPSNIALIKYWGKKGIQLPCNPSLSFTLKKCLTKTSLTIWDSKTGEDSKFSLLFKGKEAPKFYPKVLNLIEYAKKINPELKNSNFKIETDNTFPHSAGIASSASSMSALALCLNSINSQSVDINDQFLKETSSLARLGSGSACRSLYGGVVSWGRHEEKSESSDQFSTPVRKVSEVFLNYRDTVVIVEEKEKRFSSSLGHKLMNGHDYSGQRYQEAANNYKNILIAMKSGDISRFGEILEQEALSLHALMMSAPRPYILMKPETLSVIEKVQEYRRSTNMPLYFTLDAGPNVHLLYPQRESSNTSNLDVLRILLEMSDISLMSTDDSGLFFS